MAPLLKGKSISWDQKNRALKGAHDLKNQDAIYGPRQDPIQGFNFASNGSKLVPTNLDFGPSSKVGHTSLHQWQTL
jgi:hypothetical protein